MKILIALMVFSANVAHANTFCAEHVQEHVQTALVAENHGSDMIAVPEFLGAQMALGVAAYNVRTSAPNTLGTERNENWQIVLWMDDCSVKSIERTKLSN